MAKCARPGCENEARTEKPNSCCSNACNSAMSRGEVVVTKICVLPGCGKLARSNRPNAACCKSHSRLYYNLCHPERIEAFNQLKREIRKQQKINKEAEKVCVCGCNETFVSTSNSQKYKNKTHKNRVTGQRKYERKKSERKKSDKPEYEKLDAKFSEMKNWMKAEKGSFQAHLIKKRGEKFLITACKVALNSTLAVSASITATRCFECMERG